MKNQIFKTIFILATFFAMSSCGNDDDGDNPIIVDPNDPGVIQGTVLEGDITADLLMPRGNYTLKGSVFVKDGATLTIEKGSRITVTAADQAAGVNLIIVEQGGKIIADGTAAEPIVFTSENQNAEGGDGDWGGIGIHGKARINAPGGTSLSEAGQVPYGGTDDADNSGVLRYVRVEYAGAASSDGQFEFNAFSFFGVGSGTVLENCEAFEGADDGFEFFGGTVNGTNLSMVGMEDDSIDWDEGYRGTLNNIVIFQYDNIGDFAFELANRSGENNATPRSKPTVNNVTVRGSNRAGKAAIDLKQGTGGIFNNIVVNNVESVVFLNNQLQEVQNGDLEFTNANFSFSTNLVVNNVDGTDVASQFISQNTSATGADESVFSGWSNFGGIDVDNSVVIEGDITGNLFVPTGNHTLRGAVFVKDGATLTIEKGSTITVTAADQAAGVNLIIVERGGKIIADGTAAEPIVFTSENRNAEGGDGDWGGIGIHGKARINAPGGESLSEAGQVPYGGTDDADNSGVLRYVRIEYAGAASSDGSFEFNAFSFFGVGSGTILENCEAFEGADDGFEFFGGKVNGTNLSVVGMEDDSIDWDEGYRGTLNNIVIYQYDNIGDFAFELANRSGENNATPRSNATVSNVTVRGSNRAGKAAFDLKQGTGGIFNNIVVTNVESVIFLNNQLQEVQNGDLEFTNANFTFSTNLVVNNVDGTDVSAQFISQNASAAGADESPFEGWSNFSNL